MKGGQDPFMASTGIDWTAAEPACNAMDHKNYGQRLGVHHRCCAVNIHLFVTFRLDGITLYIVV
jgi:hypothetical protein